MTVSVPNGSTHDDALAGNVRDFPLPLILRTLETKRRSGALRLGTGAEIWVADGRIYLATTPTSPPLSSVLAGAGLAPAGEIDRMFADTGDPRSVLDQLLPSYLERHPIVERLLQEYTLAALFEMLLPGDAAFVFDDGRRHRLGDRLAGPSGELINQAEHRLTIWTRIATRIPSTSTRFRLAPVLPDGAWERLVAADEWRLLALLDGQRTLADVVVNYGGSAFGVCSSLYRLLVEGVVQQVEARDAPDRPAVGAHIGTMETRNQPAIGNRNRGTTRSRVGNRSLIAAGRKV